MMRSGCTRVLWGSFFSGLVALFSCGPAPCGKQACPEAVKMEFIDANGWPVLVFEGSVTLDHVTHQFGCNTAYPFVEGPLECGVGELLLSGVAASEPAFFLTAISDANGYFSGRVDPDYRVEEDFNGPGCGRCASGGVEILLRGPGEGE